MKQVKALVNWYGLPPSMTKSAPWKGSPEDVSQEPSLSAPARIPVQLLAASQPEAKPTVGGVSAGWILMGMAREVEAGVKPGGVAMVPHTAEVCVLLQRAMRHPAEHAHVRSRSITRLTVTWKTVS